jgi:predicted kinase
MSQKTLYIIRGLPGSGKSTMAKKLVGDGNFFEADMYFIDSATGEYKFNPTFLWMAHAWCQAAVESHMEKGLDVAVSNTFTTMREMREYLQMAEKHNYSPVVIHMESQFESIHGVPAETMDKMRARWESFGA